MPVPQTRVTLLILLLIVLQSLPATAQVPYAVGDWPQWRGPHADGISLDTGLLRQWPAEGPKKLWQVDTVGVAYSSLAIKDGRLFTQGDLHGVEHVVAINVADGSVVWARQPEPVAQQLANRVATELKQLDKNQNGQIEEAEALARVGWDFNKFDLPANGALEEMAAERAVKLVAAADRDGDGQLSFSEAGNLLRDYYERIDAADPQANAADLATERTTSFMTTLDKDADGKVSRQESRGSWLDRQFGRIDQRDPGADKGDDLLTADEIGAYLAKSEAGKDGLITAREIGDYYIKNKVAGDGIWSPEELQAYYGGYRNGMGDGPRGTPTVDGPRVYTEGGLGDVTCFDAASGSTLWHVNLRSQFGGGVPGWGYSESPLVVGELVIVTPGGKQGTLLALDKHTGKPVWQSGDVTEGAHYSSPLLAEIGGVRQIVQFARESVFGVALEDGKLLWKYGAANNGTANCCSPIVFDDHVFASSGYGTGGGLAKISTSGSRQGAEQVYFEKKMACHHGGIVKLGDYMYSNGGGALMCMNYLTGQIAWQSRSVGKGSLVAADGLLFLLSENHQAALVEATPDEYRERGKFSIVSHGKPSWAHPVVVGGRLFIRDQNSLTAYDACGK